MAKSLDLKSLRWGTELVKRGFAKMQKGGVVMDVTNASQAAIAEKAGAVAVMALERVPADIRAQGGVARMSDPSVIKEIINTVTIPVMAKCRIGHFVEAQVLEGLGVDMIDESEVLTIADPFHHVWKQGFKVPFVCGARDFGEAVRRIFEGAAMIRTKGEAGTGNIIEAVRHRRMIATAIDQVKLLNDVELIRVANTLAQRYDPLPHASREGLGFNGSLPKKTPPALHALTSDQVGKGLYDVLKEVRKLGRLPVVDFAAGGIATPADAALMMQLGNDGVFVGSGIFKSKNPGPRAKAIVEAVTHFDDAKIIADVSQGLGEAMPGINVEDIPAEMRLASRGI
jgi:pyridoxal 5'-phosphate synthase pdxS subunit